MSTDVLAIEEEQALAAIKAKFQAEREARAKKEAEEAARKAAEQPKLLAHTKVEGGVLASSVIQAEQEADFVVMNDDCTQSRVRIKHERPRTSREQAVEARTLLDPDGSVWEDAQAAFVDAVANAWGVRKGSKAFASLTFHGLLRGLQSLHSSKGTMAQKSYLRFKPVIKVLTKRVR